MKKYGAIDIGTNSIRMLIANVVGDNIIGGHKDLITSRIGEKVDETGYLQKAAIKRSIEALNIFIKKFEVENIYEVPIIATSAVRDAKNSKEFIDMAKSEIGADITIIDGAREAELGFLGAINGTDDYQDNILIVDIGGGSTELIVGDKEEIKFLKSINIGAVRMTEKYLKTDPICKKDIEILEHEIDNALKEVTDIINKYSISKLIGIGGTVTTICSVNKKMEIYNRDKIHNSSVSIDEIGIMLDEFINKNLDERKKIIGLQPKRADIITAGTLILYRIMKILNKESITISEYDNLEGLIFERIR